ncbi:hypothetical protein QYF36_007681 [Acer negundo]|nr:hypothetical protein QYF36_007681 [Acer negundo]
MSAAWEDGEEQWLDRLGGGEGANCNEKFKVLDQVEPHDTKLSWASHKDLGQLKPTKDRPITKTGCDGQKSLETCQEIEETRIIGLGQNKTAGQHWKRVTRIPSLSDKNQFFGIELGKRSEADIVKDLRTLKKKVRVQNNDNKCGKVGSKDVDDQSSNTSMEGIDQVERKKAEKEVLESRNRVCEMVDMAKAEEVVAATMTFKKVLVAANKGISQERANKMEDIRRKIQVCGERLAIWNAQKRKNLRKDIMDRRSALRKASQESVALGFRRRTSRCPRSSKPLLLVIDAFTIAVAHRSSYFGKKGIGDDSVLAWCESFLAAFWDANQHIQANFSPLIAKAMTILQGINLAFDSNLIPIVIETDSLAMVKLIEAKSPSLANICLVIGEIVETR